MLNITELDESVWRRIAAGEVVERPASAVKELVENSIDAQAKRIRVSLKDGGRLSIIVEDDGTGIAFDELPLALMYHATSKIATLDDLEHIMTLGYRGEALASLAAVADVELRSRREGSERGGIIRTHDGKITEHIPANCPKGTLVKVENLFSGLPARRKFLKSAAGELKRCAVFLREYSVCNPNIAFTLEHNGKVIFATDGAGDKGRVLAKLWGAGAEIQCVNVKAGSTELECWFQARAGMAVRGDVMAFVNGRAVNDPIIRSALNQAARDLAGNYALFFSMIPSLVDVNIHPAKSEVRFRNNGEIYDAIHEAVSHLGSPMPLPEILSTPSQITAPSASPARVSASSASPAKTAGTSSGWNFSDAPTKIIPQQRDAEPFERQETMTLPEPAEPKVRYLGQSSAGYLIYDTADAIVLMDPHAGHERVNYERIKAQAESSRNAQKLLMPARIHPTSAIEVHEHEQVLREAGFVFGSTAEGMTIEAVPSIGADVEPDELLKVSLAALRESHGRDGKTLLWRLWAEMACKASVKLTSELSCDEAISLWRELHDCEQPFTCPHGRPTLIEIKRGELLKHFGR